MKWLIILLWVILGIFNYSLKNNYQSNCCLNNTSTEAQEQSNDTNSGEDADDMRLNDPLLFEYSKETPILSQAFESHKAKIIAGLKEGQSLVITGYYGAEERNNSGMENLGIARAEAVKKLFVKDPGIPAERIITKGTINNSVVSKDSRFNSCAFSVMDKVAAKPDNNKKDKIVKLEKRTLIYFESGMDKPIRDQEVMSYLDEVSKIMSQTDQKIVLTGHTDSRSSSAFNKRLGLRRAKKVARYLESKGVPASKIMIRSEGELHPIATNKTKEGRQKNRRVELEIK